jgi:hypothetical protein
MHATTKQNTRPCGDAVEHQNLVLVSVCVEIGGNLDTIMMSKMAAMVQSSSKEYHALDLRKNIAERTRRIHRRR